MNTGSASVRVAVVDTGVSSMSPNPLRQAPSTRNASASIIGANAGRTSNVSSLMFSSNYPYWLYGEPFAMVEAIPEGIKRRVMVEDPELPFPESVAAAEIHKAGQQGARAAKILFLNMGIGAFIMAKMINFEI